MSNLTILILGATGMLGHVLFEQLSNNKSFTVYGTLRKRNALLNVFPNKSQLIENIEASDLNSIESVIAKLKPDIVINCIGIIKQLPAAQASIPTISINALFPHQLSEICLKHNARLIHFSTDCIFSGSKGNYSENDESDATDLYGRTKFLGELNYSHCFTLRTSIIGHELQTKHALVDWFLSQKEKVRGYTNAIYTGFPSIEIAELIEKNIIPNPRLSGVLHVASNPINKFELLKIVASIYKKEITIEPYNEYICDRSLNGIRFNQLANYHVPEWNYLVLKMYNHYQNSLLYIQ